jgi:enoyl-CoA hydratase
VRATLDSARLAARVGEAAAEAEIVPTIRNLLASEDARIRFETIIDRETPDFVGR